MSDETPPANATLTGPTMLFVGVTTGQSASVRIFPRWVAAMGIPQVQLAGVDLPLHAPPDQYHRLVTRIKADPQIHGAIITSHKVDFHEAAADLFDELDGPAHFWREISCISKRDGRLIGRAIDPITAGQTLREIVGDGYWGRTNAELLLIGGGGTAAAIIDYLLRRPDADDIPRHITIVNRTRPRLDSLRAMIEQLPPRSQLTYLANDDPRRNDRILAALPAGSLVINATGMGKDRPGSPLTDDAIFPLEGIAWELNYRGALDFLHQTRRQQQARRLTVHDGWRYFTISWTEHIREVFHLSHSDEERRALYSIGIE